MKKLTPILGVVAVALIALAAGLYIGKALLPGASPKTDPRDELIKSQVQSAYSVLDQLNKKAQAGEIKLSYAKKLGADILREMRYGQDGYFFADTSEGVNVVLYGDKTVEGKNRRDANINGVYYVQKIAEAAKTGNGYTDYFFPKKGETAPSAKKAFSMYFQPFDWVIGTGYYR
ncbi:MAG: cache domain-containing protein [Patescibacteria group bacterium]|nr:cache domain-containing protein [Patescibacteria group bacterium]